MKLLLDTHAFLWAVEGSARLGRAARRRMQRADAVYVSAASLLEIALKMSAGKLRLKLASGQSLDTLVTDAGFEELAVRGVHATAVLGLPLVHGDPYDRLLVAQARVEGLTLVTADEVLHSFGVPVLDASI
ncbi:MAG: type II toxin-antitoxin system VapC family toxin [Deltaproteobacteria bacterium]|nr:type II toxin-antitoxin system VapC family toxin [Deltaproteobacteria bacterium]